MNYRIQSITVEGLFGMFDHHIPLNQKERITIVYGVNGIGKTMIIRMVDALFTSKLLLLYSFPFHKFKITFTSNQYIEVIKEDGKIDIIYSDKSGEVQTFSHPAGKLVQLSSDEIIAHIVNNHEGWEIIKGRLINKKESKHYTTGDIFKSYPKLIYTKEDELPKDLKTLLSKSHVRYISTDRLYRDDFLEGKHSLDIDVLDYRSLSEKRDMVFICSESLCLSIRMRHWKYARKSEELEVSLGKRLLDKIVKTDYSYKQLIEENKIVNSKRNELKSVGLINGKLNDNFVISKDMDDLSRAVVSVNIQDVKLKLKIFDDLYEKLQLFVSILNNNRLAFKKIQISSERGFIFKDDNGVELTPDQLSSGEQHELVLLYLLIFDVPENALVMIDEPEISHHIMWKKSFVEDMLEIIKLRNFDVYVNTHSPSIVNGNWDMTIPLREEELVEEN